MVPVPVPATCFTRQFRTVHGRGRRSSMLVVLTTARSDPVAMNRAAGALPVSITPKLISWVPTPNPPEAPPESPEPDSFTNSVVATPPDGLQQSDPATAATCVAGPAASVTSAICVPGRWRDVGYRRPGPRRSRKRNALVTWRQDDRCSRAADE